MNTLRNQVSLIGRLGSDIDLKTISSGKKLARVTIATNEPYKNKEGEWVENTQWHSILAWGTTAEMMAKKLAKGVEVILGGRLVNRSYETREGDKRYSTEIEVNEFIVLSSKFVK